MEGYSNLHDGQTAEGVRNRCYVLEWLARVQRTSGSVTESCLHVKITSRQQKKLAASVLL